MEQDLHLVKRCLAGEDSAWEQLLIAHNRKIYNLCYRFTGRSGEAEDLTQEVFIKVFQTLATYDAAQGSFGTWLNRVARNHLVDHYRRTRKDRVTSSLEDETGGIEDKPSAEESPMARLETRERRELLQSALDQLSPDMREAVILRDFQDLDYDEIAQVLQVPQGTVKSRINRGRLELAKVIKRMEGVRGE
ncbi:MAG TPA: sigma-70 family RNA polymerase sigma factor [Terriglobia bacterium]|nr:sigma-70 family RNA polymerase sigma factor [Terriglobia bacterium]